MSIKPSPPNNIILLPIDRLHHGRTCQHPPHLVYLSGKSYGKFRRARGQEGKLKLCLENSLSPLIFKGCVK